MLKKISIVTALSATLLLGGAFQSSVDASESVDQSQAKVYYSINSNWNNDSWGNLNKYIYKFQSGWNKPKWDYKQDQKKEQPKAENPKQEQPEAENPKQEQVPTEEKVEQAPKEEQPSQEQSQQLSQYEQQVVEYTNNERTKNGLAPFKIDTELSRVARDKSRDMAGSSYFDHNSPTYGSPFDMMKSYGITYRTAGENIAKGQPTPQEVVTAWMNSPGHKANILNGNFTHIGVGFVEQGSHWTQMFIGK